MVKSYQSGLLRKRSYRVIDVASQGILWQRVTQLCDYCCRSQHVTGDCPLLSGPKPVATIYGVCCQELKFFESTEMAPMTHIMDSSFPAVVKVTNGVLTEAQIVRRLRELVLGNYQWDLVKLENQTYKVDFPTKED